MTNEITLKKILALPGKTAIYWDMDGTLAEFDRICNYPKYFYINKRPINAVLNAAKRLDENQNIDSFVLSKLPPIGMTYEESERTKNIWLDNHAPFIRKQNRVFTTDDTILEDGTYFGKYGFFKNLLENNKDYDNIVFVDDDMRHIVKCSELENIHSNFILIYTLELVD